MDENTFKIGANSDKTAQTTAVSTNQAAPQPANQPLQPPTAPSPPNINTKLNVQLDKSVDTQLGRLGLEESKLLSTKSYLIIGILVIALAAASYGAYIFFFTAESAMEESSEDITLTNKLGESEAADLDTLDKKNSSPPSLTINLPEETTADTPTDVVDNTNTPAYTPTNSKIPR